METATPDGYLSKTQASDYLGIGVRTIDKRLYEIPHFKLGRRILFKKSELDEWMERYRESSIDISKLADDVVKDVLSRN